MPVVVGVGRSGTTLLRLMLDSHPLLAVPPETGFLPEIEQRAASLDADSLAELIAGFHTWPDFRLDPAELRAELRRLEPFSATAGARCFYRVYARRFEKTRWGDKTPVYCRSMPAIERLLPEAHFIHLIRDGRDVALSLRPLWFAPGQDMRTLAAYWRDDVEAARRDGAGCRRYLELRYEELVLDPEEVLRRICAFLDLPFAVEMHDYHSRAALRMSELEGREMPALRITREQRLAQHPLLDSPPRPERVGRWREAMTPDERREFEAVAGELLATLGY
jgi:hypothetical protein